mgnify:CR=1 FL=1
MEENLTEEELDDLLSDIGWINSEDKEEKDV